MTTADDNDVRSDVVTPDMIYFLFIDNLIEGRLAPNFVTLMDGRVLDLDERPGLKRPFLDLAAGSRKTVRLTEEAQPSA